MQDDDPLSEAVVVWSGFGEFAWPHRDEGRVLARFGEDLALDLLPRVKQLEDEFYQSDARLTEADLVAVGRKAAAHFRSTHPEVSDVAVEALTWCYTFDYK